MKGPRSETTRRRALTRGAMPLALFCLVLQLGSAAHFLLAPHSICLEHGEIVDGAAHHVAGVALPVGRSGRLSAPTDPSEAAIHQHDHCLLAQHRRDRADLPRDSVRVAACPTTTSACLPPEWAAAHSSLALILVAPKSSPPVRPLAV